MYLGAEKYILHLATKINVLMEFNVGVASFEKNSSADKHAISTKHPVYKSAIDSLDRSPVDGVHAAAAADF